MIQVSVITDEIGQDFERALDVALSEGVRHVELRTLWEKNVVDLTIDDVKRAVELLEAREMEVVAIAGPVFKTFLDPDRPGEVGDTFSVHERASVEEHFAILDRAIDMAEAFGTDLVRTFAFWRQGAPTPEIYDAIEGHLRKALAVAALADCRLILENEHACFIGTAGESIEILNRIKSDDFGLIWDPGNASMLEPPSEVYPGGYEAIKAKAGFERIFHVHLKDPVTKVGKKGFTEFGKGELDYHSQIRALVEDGYEGAISMETHWRDAGREESTRLSLRGLWRIIEELGLRSHFY